MTLRRRYIEDHLLDEKLRGLTHFLKLSRELHPALRFPLGPCARRCLEIGISICHPARDVLAKFKGLPYDNPAGADPRLTLSLLHRFQIVRATISTSSEPSSKSAAGFQGEKNSSTNGLIYGPFFPQPKPFCANFSAITGQTGDLASRSQLRQTYSRLNARGRHIRPRRVPENAEFGRYDYPIDLQPQSYQSSQSHLFSASKISTQSHRPPKETKSQATACHSIPLHS